MNGHRQQGMDLETESSGETEVRQTGSTGNGDEDALRKPSPPSTDDYEKRHLHETVKRYRIALETRDFVRMANVAAVAIQGMRGNQDDRYVVHHFGVCPACLEDGACLHVGRDEWFVCHRHQVRWLGGSNLFSSWREMTEEQFRRNAALLKTYQDVKPLHVLEESRTEQPIAVGSSADDDIPL